MKIYENKSNWIIEDQLDEKIVQKINNFIDENVNNFLKLKEGYSTTGKNVEQYWLMKDDFYFRNDNFENIKNEYKFQILNRLKKSNILDEKIRKNIDIESSNCWSVIGEKNSYHTPHYHNSKGRVISTIVYLKVPETNKKDDPENNLYLIMDCEMDSVFYENKPKLITINPTVGKLLIFPGWIIHGTLPQSEGIRQTFNMEYYFAHKKENINILKYN